VVDALSRRRGAAILGRVLAVAIEDFLKQLISPRRQLLRATRVPVHPVVEPDISQLHETLWRGSEEIGEDQRIGESQIAFASLDLEVLPRRDAQRLGDPLPVDAGEGAQVREHVAHRSSSRNPSPVIHLDQYHERLDVAAQASAVRSRRQVLHGIDSFATVSPNASLEVTERESARRPVAARAQPPAVAPMPAEADVVIGRLLGDAREDSGLPQSAAARVLGVAQSRIAKLELGRARLLFVEAAVLAQLYDIPIERLDPRRFQPRPRAGRRKRVDLKRFPPVSE
jgi:hypothetical protein